MEELICVQYFFSFAILYPYGVLHKFGKSVPRVARNTVVDLEAFGR